ncbi:MAG TPA: hypothetical protein VF076_08130 [Acidimicrobiales bacterium]
MPWCEHCAKFWTPSSMKADGSCPTCGRVLPRAPAAAPGEVEPGQADAGEGEPGPALRAKDVNLREMAGKDARAPWHFKLLMVLLAIYLGWRLVQLIQLVI